MSSKFLVLLISACVLLGCDDYREKPPVSPTKDVIIDGQILTPLPTPFPYPTY